MNINWYSFYHKIYTMSTVILILGLIILLPFHNYDPEVRGLWDTSGDFPFLITVFVVVVFSSLMLVKYRNLRGIPERTTKKEGRIYGVIGISLILLFLLLVILLPLIF